MTVLPTADVTGTTKQFTRGTHRAVEPEETLKHACALASLVGITRVANVTGLDRIGLPVVAVHRPNSRSLVVSQGKGLDLVAAKVSGMMEAIESYHAERPELLLRLESYEALSERVSVLNVGALPRISTGSFSPTKRILWCEGRKLGTDEPHWVPYEAVHTDFTLPLPSGSGCFMMSSNGLASGNHLLEAISHGIGELVERDAMALWELSGGTRRREGRVDPRTIDDPACQQILERFSAAQIAYGIWDATSDVGMATFVCFIADEPGAPGHVHVSHGSGCHPCREIALLRALTEAAQTRLTYIAGARDDADHRFFARARAVTRVEEVRQHIMNADDGPAEVHGKVALRDFRDVPTHTGDTFDEDVFWELECLRGVGLDEVVVVDLSRRDLPIAVVRVLIPGLEGLHDAPGYVAGARASALLARMAS
jgi:ribosomal protein S12 methylthiotransferase accessory factor